MAITSRDLQSINTLNKTGVALAETFRRQNLDEENSALRASTEARAAEKHPYELNRAKNLDILAGMELKEYQRKEEENAALRTELNYAASNKVDFSTKQGAMQYMQDAVQNRKVPARVAANTMAQMTANAKINNSAWAEGLKNNMKGYAKLVAQAEQSYALSGNPEDFISRYNRVSKDNRMNFRQDREVSHDGKGFKLKVWDLDENGERINKEPTTSPTLDNVDSLMQEARKIMDPDAMGKYFARAADRELFNAEESVNPIYGMDNNGKIRTMISRRKDVLSGELSTVLKEIMPDGSLRIIPEKDQEAFMAKNGIVRIDRDQFGKSLANRAAANRLPTAAEKAKGTNKTRIKDAWAILKDTKTDFDGMGAPQKAAVAEGMRKASTAGYTSSAMAETNLKALAAAEEAVNNELATNEKASPKRILKIWKDNYSSTLKSLLPQSKKKSGLVDPNKTPELKKVAQTDEPGIDILNVFKRETKSAARTLKSNIRKGLTDAPTQAERELQ